MTKLLKISLFSVLFISFSVSGFAQTKSRKPKPKKPVKTIVSTTATTAVKTPPKKNERPADVEVSEEINTPTEPQKANQNGKSNQRPVSKKPAFEPNYFYEFTQPAFVISQINIAHDEKGKGEISFMKKDYDEAVRDPIQVSAAALERINNALSALDFFNSTESYQYEKDYSHLGNIKLKIKKGANTERETKFNWTQNENAKVLADEYRKIGQQYIWIFDINLARENQPLEAPKLLDTLDSFIRRNEVSDAEQMIPFLKEVSNDERIPLIARNHAARLVEKIEKKK